MTLRHVRETDPVRPGERRCQPGRRLARRAPKAVPGRAALPMRCLAQLLEDTLGYTPLGTGLRLMHRGADAPGRHHIYRAAARGTTRWAGRSATAGRQVHAGARGRSVQPPSMLWISLAAATHLTYWQIVAPLAPSDAGFGGRHPGRPERTLAMPEGARRTGTAPPPTFANCRKLFS
jgi:hypothetical protein